VASVGGDGAVAPDKEAFAQTSQTAGVAGGVNVFTAVSRAAGASSSDEPFHLAIFC
jgi:hypothetical protein